jgi:hypothetical protein
MLFLLFTIYVARKRGCGDGDGDGDGIFGNRVHGFVG